MKAPYLTKSTRWDAALVEGGQLFAVYFKGEWLVARCLVPELVPKEDTNWPNIAAGNAAGPLTQDGVTAGTIPMAPTTLAAEGAETYLYHEQKKEIWQVFMGISTPLVYVYREVPTGDRHGELGNLHAPNLQAAAVSTWGWNWGGWESFKGDERAVSMSFIPYKQTSAYAVFNVASYAQQPTVRWLINKILFDPLDPADKQDAKLIEDVLKGRIADAIKWSAGVDGMDYQPGFRDVFGVDPVVMTKRQLYRNTTSGKVPLGE